MADRTEGLPGRARFLEPRDADTYCRIHKVEIDKTGYCVAAGAYWVPKFSCPNCGGPLWDNGYCANCTPKLQAFPGDYFEQTWDAGPHRGHFVRIHRGPTPAHSRAEVDGYFAELRALIGKVKTVEKEPGDDSEVPF